MTPPEEIEREKYRKIGFGVDGISQKDITNPELFYPTITEKVIERLRVSQVVLCVRMRSVETYPVFTIWRTQAYKEELFRVLNDPRTSASSYGIDMIYYLLSRSFKLWVDDRVSSHKRCEFSI